jgi:hypothetical protein
MTNDPNVPPVIKSPVHYRQEEIEEMQAMIDKGELPKDAIEQHRHYEALNVYGADAKRDANGNFIEAGIGSAQQPSRNSIEAYRKWGREEPDYHEHLARMERELAAYQQKQASKRPAPRLRP